VCLPASASGRAAACWRGDSSLPSITRQLSPTVLRRTCRRASINFGGKGSGRVETAGSGLNLSRAELALEDICQLVVHERDAYVDRAAVVAGLSNDGKPPTMPFAHGTGRSL